LLQLKEGADVSAVNAAGKACMAGIPGIEVYECRPILGEDDMSKPFTHGVYLAFKDKAVLDLYGTTLDTMHELHKAIGLALIPQVAGEESELFTNMKVFNFQDVPTEIGQATVRRLAYLKLKPSVTEEQIDTVRKAMQECKAIPGFIYACIGTPVTPPNDMSKPWTHCIAIGFKDKDALDAYLPHDLHKAVAALFIPDMLDGEVGDCLRVINF